jgi:hypothetical protein
LTGVFTKVPLPEGRGSPFVSDAALGGNVLTGFEVGADVGGIPVYVVFTVDVKAGELEEPVGAFGVLEAERR